MSATVDLVVDGADGLGESPVWLEESDVLVWLDLEAPALHAWDGERRRTVRLPLDPPLGAVVRTDAAGTLLLAHGQRLDLLAVIDGRLQPLLRPLAGLPDLHANDAKTDRRGRVWLSTAHRTEQDPRGVLIRLEGREAHVADAGFVVGNGPAFSLDGSVVYVADSMSRTVWRYRLGDDGALRDRAAHVHLEEDEGLPDGITVDAEDGLWVACWGGGAVHRYDGAGRRTHRIEVPARQVASVAFGGAHLDTLFITSARTGLDAVELEGQPHAGALFAVQPGPVGVPETRAAVPHA